MRMLIAGLITALLLAGCAAKPAESQATRQVPIDASNIAAAQAAGYKVVNEKGKTLLCRKEQETGSHVRFKTSCMTPEEWAQLTQDNRANVEGMAHRRPPPNCRNSGLSC